LKGLVKSGLKSKTVSQQISNPVRTIPKISRNRSNGIIRGKQVNSGLYIPQKINRSKALSVGLSNSQPNTRNIKIKAVRNIQKKTGFIQAVPSRKVVSNQAAIAKNKISR
jgi:hypothetical protein